MFNIIKEFERLTTNNNKNIKIIPDKKPHKFIFDIIKKIITDKNKNWCEYFIYGGYIRDILIGEEYKYIDIFISDKYVIEQFIDFLKITNYLIKINNINDYGYTVANISIKYNNKIIDLDITNHNFDYVCDFTVNNLIYTSDGKIDCRIKNNTEDSFDFMNRCIQDCYKKKLIWMIDTNNTIFKTESLINQIKILNVLKMRYNKMVNKRYIDNGEYLYTKSINLDIFKIPENEQDPICGICRCNPKDHDNQKDTITFKCNHYFCMTCILQWMETELKSDNFNNHKCVYCRKNLSL